MFSKTILSAIAALLALPAIAQSNKPSFDEAAMRKLQLAEYAISQFYVDSVDEQKLVENGIRGMLEKLDPHSSYTTAKQTKALNEPLAGNFEGIGVQFNVVEDTLLVIQTISDGPSERAGIIAGDRIVSVNDTAIAGVKMPQQEMVSRLRGPKGSKVRLGVVRPDIADTLHFNVTRDKIPIKTIDAAYMIRPQVGYIRLGSFGATTHKEFVEAVEKLQGQGMTDLILDLQGNGGGYLGASVDIANEFLSVGDLIVYTDGRNARRRDYHAYGNGRLLQGNVVVLIDEYSASAAEIVTGAIQDQDRGTVVGRRSFGKGLVQRPIDLPDGSMIRLTVAHYYTPAGRCIQKPYVKGKAKDYAQDVYNRLKHGELTNADSIHFNDSLLCYTLRRHRPVYGGGGIMPDEFVPLDTTKYTAYHRQLSAKNIILNNSLRYVDRNRKKLQRQYATFEQFKSQYLTPQALTDSIFAQARRQGIHPANSEELEKTLPQLQLQLKALVARDLWTISEYYNIINDNNAIVLRGIEVMDALRREQ